MAALLLDVRRRDDLSWQVQPFAQVVETLGSERVVVVLPGELGLEIAAGCEGLAGFDDLEFIIRQCLVSTFNGLRGAAHT